MITVDGTLAGTLSSAATIAGSITTSGLALSAVLSITPAAPAYDFYDGEYEVTPHLHDPVVLDTYNKIMQDDVTIHEIPITRTSNPQDGITVLIG